MRKYLALLALLLPAWASAGSLSMTVALSATAANLTTVGTSDWAAWNGGGLGKGDWKSGAGATISDAVIYGAGGTGSYTSDARTISWTDGTNTPTSSETAGIYNNGGVSGDGLTLTFPASTSSVTLKIYLGVFNISTAATVAASLSDGSASPQTDSTTLVSSSGASADGVVTLTYAANSGGQTLTVHFYVNAVISSTSNVTLQAAAYSGGIATCTHSGWTSTRTKAVPTAGSTLVWLSTRVFGTVDCASTNFWQIPGGVFGAN